MQIYNCNVLLCILWYEEGSDYYYLIGGTIGCDSEDDEYYIIVEYNGIQYIVEDEILYEKYKDKIGEKVIGVMRNYIYDNGDRQYEIIWLY